MKKLYLLAILFLVGCDGSKNTPRQAIIDKYNTTDVAEIRTDSNRHCYIIRDTNGTIWSSDVAYDTGNCTFYIKSSTLIFSAQK